MRYSEDLANWLVKEVEEKYKLDLKQRLFDFAIAVLKFLKTIDSNRLYDVFRYQVSKSASSVGANYEEAQAAFSKKEFASKIGICLKEARETNYFLRLIMELNISNKENCNHLVRESDELQKILGSILIKIRKQL
jgi:four helix bundle protein